MTRSIREIGVSDPRDLPEICDCGGSLEISHFITSDTLMYEAVCAKCGAVYRADGWWGIYRWIRIKQSPTASR